MGPGFFRHKTFIHNSFEMFCYFNLILEDVIQSIGHQKSYFWNNTQLYLILLALSSRFYSIAYQKMYAIMVLICFKLYKRKITY